MYNSKKTFIKCLMVLMTLIGGQIIFSTPVFGVTSPILTINLSALTPLNLTPGHFGSVSQTINITTNNYTGYTTTLTNPTNSTDLINTLDITLTIPTITLPNNTQSISPSDFTNGYGINTDGSNFSPAPNLAGSIPIGSTNSTGSNSYTLTFGAKPATETKAGTYAKTFIIMAVANNPQYSISYESNSGSDTVTNMPNNESTAISSTGIVTISNTTPSRTGYTFLGWDTDDTATTPTYAAGNTNTITLEPTQANSITLYAIWALSSREIHDTTTTVYDPSAVPAGYTVYFENPNIEGKPVVKADDDGNIISFEYTDTGANGISFTTGHTLDTGIEAFDGEGFTIHLKITMNSNRNNGKYLVSAIKQLENTNNIAGFNFYCGSNTYFYLNASQSTSINSTTFGSRINSNGWRVQSNRTQTYTLDIVYTPTPNKSISTTFTPVSSGSSSFYTDSTNLNYIPDNLAGATISLSGNGLSGNTSKDLSEATVLEFSVTKNTQP